MQDGSDVTLTVALAPQSPPPNPGVFLGTLFGDNFTSTSPL